MGTSFIKIDFEKIERYKGITEYDFYLVDLVGQTKDGNSRKMFIKKIKRGKIKESLFCICDLTYEKYLKNKSKKLKKISIIEQKEAKKNINKVSVKLFEENLNAIETNIEVYFINVFDILNNEILKERMENSEINQKDIIIMGIENNT